ncbi:PLP-dependent aminotransferase family protein [Lactiplantibacillus pentosus]|uniref:PLP-dependent aminotransferase family protein n=3 Tax=Lactiplantibacillus pentosus TaxID=1589 RepID=A0AAX6LB23_LACPE|nr:PLP-dependent aminotransferase family protein [Lactiplantibacillus pentosus]AYJ42662.1 PLP-dependent aminotransferase family protein [Lactiplantibacillus pentosus]KRK26131.1 aminotransferase with n-terminal regulator domain [Lactiplantibacillus pentosus DSM 20314]MBU7498286.1 PLP-dependent aminotransferase family protein [Lactiplantibacillus pentosus]MCT3300308.1 PLP-dependent aminotransferase family protein [Lactiplantibacillus pentosus]MCT3314535.1 PLP-dependent aminotransferase family pr
MPLNRSERTPMYLQLYRQLRADYDDTRANQPLWSIRKMAQNLGVSKTTVAQAYDQLVAEGIVYSVPGSGYYYRDQADWSPDQPSTDQIVAPKTSIPVKYDFRYGVTQLLSPSWNAWKRAVRLALRQTEQQPTAIYPDAQGLPALRAALVRFLKTTRGVHATPDQIVITNGAKAGLGILLSILPRATLGIENPGYRGLSDLAASYGHTAVNIPVTADGLDLATVRRVNPQVVYTTPGHQFPLGVILPIEQRLALLKWAGADHLIIEDDYDSEYRYRAHPLPALQSLAAANQVAYLGTFSRGIDPTLRMGYLVLPPRLVSVYHQHYQYQAEMVAGLLQQAMVNYFDDGAYYRHLSRNRSTNRQKYRCLCDQLKRSKQIRPIMTGAGVHLVVQIPSIDQATLLIALEQQQVRIYPLNSNWTAMPSADYYLLGFAGLTLADLKVGVQRLMQVCERLSATGA